MKALLKKFLPLPAAKQNAMEARIFGKIEQLQNEMEAQISGKIEQLREEVRSLRGELSALRGNEIKVILQNSKSVFSYCNNRALERQAGNSSVFDERYAHYKRLHSLLHVYAVGGGARFVRGGGRNRVKNDIDGEYVMVSPFSREKTAYSFGICDDVSWDKAMAECGYQVFMYDHTIDRLPEENDAFHWEKLGVTGETETSSLKTLASLIKENGHEKVSGMFLKMDVEGCEWEVLRSCPESVLSQFDQIALELHDLHNMQDADLHIAALENLTKNHAAVYVHGNNYRGCVFSGDLITPQTLEVTLVKKDVYELSDCDMRELGQLNKPNDPNNYEILLGNW